MQMDSPSNNDQNDKHPLPSDWSNQESFWNGNEYEKSRTYRPRPYRIPPKSDNDSDWNEKCTPIITTGQKLNPRYLLDSHHPGWPKGIRKESLPTL